MVMPNTNVGNIIKYCSIIRIDYLLEKDSLSLLCFFKENAERTILILIQLLIILKIHLID